MPATNYTVIGGTAGGASPALNAPAAVTIGTITYKYEWPNSAQTNSRQPTALVLTVPFTAPAGWIGKGVHVYIENPDQSAVAAFTLGASALDGTSQLAGAWQPEDFGLMPNDGTGSVSLRITAITTQPKDIRVYLSAYTATVDNKLVRATAASPTPSAVVTVQPPPPFASGEEFAANVTNLTASAAYGIGGNGQPVLFITASWTDPADENFGGIALILLRPPRVTAPPGTRTGVLQGNQPFSQILIVTNAETATVELSAFPTSIENDTIYAQSFDIFGFNNTYVPGVTPSVPIVLNPPPDGGSGQEKTALVSGVAATLNNFTSPDGVQTYNISGSYTPPNDITFGGVALYLRYQSGAGTIDPITGIGSTDILLGYTGSKDLTFSTDKWPLHLPLPTWDLYFVSRDVNNQQNKLVPGTTPVALSLAMTDPGGALQANRVDPATLDPTLAIFAGKLGVPDTSIAIQKFVAGIRPVLVVTSDPALPDAKYPAGTYEFNTTSGIMKRVNAAGSAWELAIHGGNDIQAGTITGNKIVANTITVGLLQAGVLAASNITAGTFVAGVVYAGQINCSQLNAGTITAAVSMTAPTLTITSGTAVINIDTTNFIKMADPSTGHVASQMLTSGFTCWSTTSPNAQVTVSASFVRGLNASATLLFDLSRATGGGALHLYDSSGAEAFGVDAGSAVTSASATGGGSVNVLPANVLGYLIVTIAGTARKIAYYAT